MKKTKSQWNELFQKKHFGSWAVIALVGLVMIFLWSGLRTFFVQDSPESKPEITAFDVREYEACLENSLKSLVESIDGAGKATVLVTVDTGIEYVYATETTSEEGASETRRSQAYVFSGGYTSSSPVLIKEVQPTVRGVVVVCRGGGNPTVRLKVTEAIKTALSIPANRVYVTNS